MRRWRRRRSTARRIRTRSFFRTSSSRFRNSSARRITSMRPTSSWSARNSGTSFLRPSRRSCRIRPSKRASYQRTVSRAAAQKSLADLKAKGMQINELAPAEIARMRQMVVPVYDKFTAEYDPARGQDIQVRVGSASTSNRRQRLHDPQPWRRSCHGFFLCSRRDSRGCHEQDRRRLL